MASNNATIKISKSELFRFKKGLSKYSNSSRNEIKKAISGAALVMESEAKQVITDSGHVDTGRLRASIVNQVTPDGYTAQLSSLEKGKPAPTVGSKSGVPVGTISQAYYGWFINYGTSRIRGIKYMQKALQAGNKYFRKKLNL